MSKPCRALAKRSFSKTRRQHLRLSLGVGAMLGTGLANAAQSEQVLSAMHWQQRVLLGFGTTLWLRAGHRDKARLQGGLDAAVKAIRQVERQMSLFDSNSAVSQLNQTGVLQSPHPDLVSVLMLSGEVSARSDGAFDVTVQPLWRAWANAQAVGRTASAQAVRDARSRVDWQALKVSATKIAFRRDGMGVTLNGIAQGYAADQARRVLIAHGIEHALLDTGEWTPIGSSRAGSPWMLGIEDPGNDGQTIAAIRSDGRSLATSSDAHYTFSADRKHHHILNPKTGCSPTKIASVTVAADSCALADALTKVMFMGSVEQALDVARQWQVDVLAIDKAGHWLASPGMPVV